MQIDFKENGTVLTAKITGEIDHHIAGELKNKIDLKLCTGIYNKFIFDFTDLSFMDSSGISVIMGRVKYLETLSGTVEIIVPNDQIEKILRISKIDKYVNIISRKENK